MWAGEEIQILDNIQLILNEFDNRLKKREYVIDREAFDNLDVIRRGDDVALITASLEFRKSKCEAFGCGRMYYLDFSFASPYVRTTRRLDNAVVRMILQEAVPTWKSQRDLTVI